jgi:hypothetical protein
MISNTLFELTGESLALNFTLPTSNEKLTPLFVNEDFKSNYNEINEGIESKIDLCDLIKMASQLVK